QFYRIWRWNLARSLACGVSLSLGALLAGGPYVMATGGITNKPTPLRMLQSAGIQGRPVDASSSADQESSRASSRSGGPLLATILAEYAPDGLEDRRCWALQAIGREVAKGYLYVMGIPVLLGMWWF